MEKHLIAARDEAWEMYKKYRNSDHELDREMASYWEGKFMAYCHALALLEIYK